MIIINYHEVSPRGGAGAYDLPVAVLRAHIEALADAGFAFVTLGDILRAPRSDGPLRCALTFDDGRLGAYRYAAPLLRERRIPATFFVCPAWLEHAPSAAAERYSDFMTWDHVAELAAQGHIVGSHSMTHAPLLGADPALVVREIADSKATIERRLGSTCEHFAPPWGHVNRALAEQVRDHGYKTLSSIVAAPNKPPYDVYRLRRFESSRFRSMRHFRRTLADCVRAQARFDVLVLRIRGALIKARAWIPELARFDLVACADGASHDLAMEFGLPCLRWEGGVVAGFVRGRSLLTERCAEMAGARQLTLTTRTVRSLPGWRLE